MNEMKRSDWITDSERIEREFGATVAATEPRRNIAPPLPYITCTINAQGLVLRADFETNDERVISGVSACIAGINAERRQEIGNSALTPLPERSR